MIRIVISWLLRLCAAGAIGVALIACSDPLAAPSSSSAAIATSSLGTAATGAATAAPTTPPETVVVCDDTSEAYPRKLFDNTRKAVIDWSNELALPGFPGAVIYVNSFVPDGNLLVINVPRSPVEPAPPGPPPAPAPTPIVNPFDEQQKRRDAAAAQRATAEASASAAAAQRDYDQALADYRAQLGRVAERIRQQTDQLSTMQPPVSADPTDLRTCLSIASERLRRAPGRRLLILSTSLDSPGIGSSDPGSGRLDGVDVYGMNVICAGDQGCGSQRAAWLTALYSLGAQSVHLFDPAQVAAETNLFVQPEGGN